MAVRTGAECITLALHAGDIAVGVQCREGDPEIIGSDVLLAVGRRPNTDDLGLDAAGVARRRARLHRVDDGLRTNVPGIWALGDCNGHGAFTHTSYNDFEIVAANLLDGDPRRVSDRIPGYALYIDPPLGRAGLTETQARAERQARCSAVAADDARRPRRRERRDAGLHEGRRRRRDASKILGAAILGTGGDEAIHGILDVMYARAPYTVLQRADADPSDRLGADPDAARRVAAGSLSVARSCERFMCAPA